MLLGKSSLQAARSACRLKPAPGERHCAYTMVDMMTLFLIFWNFTGNLFSILFLLAHGIRYIFSGIILVIHPSIRLYFSLEPGFCEENFHVHTYTPLMKHLKMLF